MDTSARVQQLGTILGVWAHPDDEVFTCGGLLSIAANNGQRVLCMTASRGEAGVQNPEKWPPEKLAQIRTSELNDAYNVLGIKDHCWFDYPDGKLNELAAEEGVKLVEQCIDECQPDSILTFGSDGMTGHTDHQAVSLWATQAGKKHGINVYHVVITPESYEASKDADKRFDIYFNIDKPVIHSKSSCDFFIQLPEDVLTKKCKALEVMPSQTQRLISYVSVENLRKMQQTEAFLLAK